MTRILFTTGAEYSRREKLVATLSPDRVVLLGVNDLGADDYRRAWQIHDDLVDALEVVVSGYEKEELLPLAYDEYFSKRDKISVDEEWGRLLVEFFGYHDRLASSVRSDSSHIVVPNGLDVLCAEVPQEFSIDDVRFGCVSPPSPFPYKRPPLSGQYDVLLSAAPLDGRSGNYLHKTVGLPEGVSCSVFVDGAGASSLPFCFDDGRSPAVLHTDGFVHVYDLAARVIASYAGDSAGPVSVMDVGDGCFSSRKADLKEAYTLFEGRQYAEAHAALTRHHTYAARTPSSELLEIACIADLGQREEALARYHLLLAKDCTPEIQLKAQFNLALCCFHLGRWDDFYGAFDAVAQLDDAMADKLRPLFFRRTD